MSKTYNIEPVNRYLLIQGTSKEESEESSVVIPDYVKKIPVHEYYEVLSKAKDCNISVNSGDLIIVNNNMVERFDFKESEQLMILENYVLAIIKRD